MRCRRRAHALSRRIIGNQLGMLLLQLLKIAVQAIIGLVGYLRVIEHIIAMIVQIDLVSQ